MTTDPFHIHPRSKRTAKSPYKPLFRKIVPIPKGASGAREASSYRGHPDYVPQKLDSVYRPTAGSPSRYGKAHGRTKPRNAEVAINVKLMYDRWFDRNVERLIRGGYIS